MKSSKQLYKLYKNTLSDNANEAQINKYKSQHSILHKLKWHGKWVYYMNNFQEYSKQSKQICQLINLLTNHCKNKWHVIEQIDVDNITCFNSTDIANRFGYYFSSIGIKIVGLTLITTYLGSPIAQLSSLCMHVHEMKYQNI